MNKLYYGDNLFILREYIKDETIDLIYLDPPFKSDANYNILYKTLNGIDSQSQIRAFDDTWHWTEETEKTYQEIVERAAVNIVDMIVAFRKFIKENDMLAYLVNMTVRLIELRRILKKSGSIYLHCDPTASHYLKLVMDTIFGVKNFKREIIWSLETSSGFKTRANNWIRSHDNLLFYAKDGEQNYFKKQYFPYKKEYIARFRKKDKNGKLYRDDRPGGRRQYLEDSKGGVAITDVWNDIMSFQQESTSEEYLGYPTQKRVKMLKRIIESSCSLDGIVLDPFCGCGTAIDAAQTLKRKWIGIDITHLAINLIKKRLKEIHNISPGSDFEVFGEPTSLAGAKELAKQDKYQFQWWITSVIEARPFNDGKKGADSGIDAVDYFRTVIENEKVIEKIIISVKGGHVTVSQIRDLKAVVERENAALGFFITLEEATRPMKEEAVKSGFYYENILKRNFRKIQILTVKEIMEGKKFDKPEIGKIQHTKKAVENVPESKKLF